MKSLKSPLRYPGGKGSMAPFLKQVIDANNFQNKPIYIEPFAGGAGAALELLSLGSVSKLVLNDRDELIHAFWDSILQRTDEFLELVKKSRINLNEYYRQRELMLNRSPKIDRLTLGFAAFFVNRCNRSGILKRGTGPIGGKAQKSEWKVDARFNKLDLTSRIKAIADFRDKIEINNEDAISFLKKALKSPGVKPSNTFIYLDPPYFKQGKSLYRYFYEDANHIELAEYLKTRQNYTWLVSYDEHRFIEDLYESEGCHPVHFQYTANNRKDGRELLISSERCVLPERLISSRKLRGFASPTGQIQMTPVIA